MAYSREYIEQILRGNITDNGLMGREWLERNIENVRVKKNQQVSVLAEIAQRYAPTIQSYKRTGEPHASNLSKWLARDVFNEDNPFFVETKDIKGKRVFIGSNGKKIGLPTKKGTWEQLCGTSATRGQTGEFAKPLFFQLLIKLSVSYDEAVRYLNNAYNTEISFYLKSIDELVYWYAIKFNKGLRGACDIRCKIAAQFFEANENETKLTNGDIFDSDGNDIDTSKLSLCTQNIYIAIEKMATEDENTFIKWILSKRHYFNDYHNTAWKFLRKKFREMGISSLNDFVFRMQSYHLNKACNYFERLIKVEDTSILDEKTKKRVDNIDKNANKRAKIREILLGIKSELNSSLPAIGGRRMLEFADENCDQLSAREELVFVRKRREIQEKLYRIVPDAIEPYYIVDFSVREMLLALDEASRRIDDLEEMRENLILQSEAKAILFFNDKKLDRQMFLECLLYLGYTDIGVVNNLLDEKLFDKHLDVHKYEEACMYAALHIARQNELGTNNALEVYAEILR